MARKRSAKDLGTRHDLHYFRRWTSGRTTRTALAVALPALAILWATLHVWNDSNALSSGPLSRAHSVFSNDCASCHSVRVAGVRFATFQRHATDAACLSCHQAPPHHPSMASVKEPSCSTCHVEHEGAVHLAHTNDRACTSCHQDLQRVATTTQVSLRVSNFNDQHPDFGAGKMRDEGTIALDHSVHMKPIQGPDGKMVQLECSDCHRVPAEAAAGWRFAAVGFKAKPADASGRQFMMPPAYAANCAGCHELRFDAKVSASAPHDKPEIVEAFLDQTYHSAARDHQPPARMLPSGLAQNSLAPRQRAEEIIWRQTCKLCHQISRSDAQSLPVVAAANIRERWMPHAKFNHDSHAALECVACHRGVLTSRATADVLMPKIETCRQCHNGDPRQAGHADNSCYECHDYHDWRQRKPFKPTYRMPHSSASDTTD